MGAAPATRKQRFLENGDHLTRAEFHARYLAMPSAKKAELIAGVVHLPSPARESAHGEPVAEIVVWLGTFRAHSRGLTVGDNATVFLDLDSEVQPDAYLRRAEGGTSRRTADDYVEGPPELVVEVAASSASIDLHSKMDAYRRAGVAEYIVWRTLDEALDWFVLVDGRYEAIEADRDGVIESRGFPGLKLDVRALLAGDHAAVLARVSPPSA